MRLQGRAIERVGVLVDDRDLVTGPGSPGLRGQQALQQCEPSAPQARERGDGLEQGTMIWGCEPAALAPRGFAPLLRQAIVAACAATETFLGDRTIGRIREIIRGRRPLPSRLAAVPLDGRGMACHRVEDLPSKGNHGPSHRALHPGVRQHGPEQGGRVALDDRRDELLDQGTRRADSLRCPSQSPSWGTTMTGSEEWWTR